MLSKIYSYAKLNIGLRILSKRDDGFHDLETIFYPVKLHDEINVNILPSIRKSNSVILRSNKSFIPLNRENLCYKAVEKFFFAFSIKDYYDLEIDLIKNIPVGGGLGGGSSNAASMIKFLTKFFGIDIESNRQKILNLALSIGSDVPFFLLMKPCYAEGRGEKIKPLKDFRIDYDILIVNPNLHISTKWAFEKLDFIPGIIKERTLSKVNLFEINNSEIFINDFEEIVFSKYGLLKEIKEFMKNNGAVYSSLSGSGATLFGLFDKNNKSTLKKCFYYFSDKKYFVYISS